MRRIADKERADQAPVWVSPANADAGQALQRVKRQLGRRGRHDVDGRERRQRDVRRGVSPALQGFHVVEDSHVYLPVREGP
jgi:hypothetical protein